MRTARLLVLVFAAASLAIDRTTIATSAVTQTGSSSSARRALLIGVNKFVDPEMEKKHELQGPENDVRLFARVLESAPFGLSDKDVTILAGLPDDRQQQQTGEQPPTRENIERQFRRLRDASKPGDQVVILFAGHGSQQPAASAERAKSEPDGLDQIILPADASGWDAQRKTVRNAILDLDVRGWVTDIRNAGAFVWIIFDSCSSATMTRGLAVQRGIAAKDLVPQAALDAAAHLAGPSGEAPGKSTPLALTENAGGIAALYAAGLTEETPERSLPAADSDVHGVFTYTIGEVLARSSSPLTYRELAERVIDRYRERQIFAPTPVFEGGGLDREVLGQRTWPDRPTMLVGKPLSAKVCLTSGDPAPANHWCLEAGSLHGLTVNSVLEVFPPAGSPNAETHVGYVKVDAVAATSAVVTPVPFNQMPPPAPDDLVSTSRARVAAYDYGNLTLKVAVERPSPKGAARPFEIVPRGQGPQTLEAALADLRTTTNGLADRVDADPDWFVRVDGDRVLLVPASGWQGPATAAGVIATPATFVMGSLSGASLPPTAAPRCPSPPEPGSTRAPDTATLSESIAHALREVARARNLMGMADNSSDVRLDLAITVFDARRSANGSPVLTDGRTSADLATARSITAGDVVSACHQLLKFQVTNRGDQPVKMTLFYLDAAFGLTALLPADDADLDNVIPAGGTKATEPLPINDEAVGWESALVIGTRVELSPQNFRMLAQPSLVQMRGIDSPLLTLLSDASFGRGQMRSPPTAARASDFVVKATSWQTLPPK